MPWFLLLLVISINLASETLAYRFICNGLLANGDERADECGICDEEHAARWKNPILELVIDYSVLPKKLTLEDWHLVIDHSLASWESVSGSNLHFIIKEEPSLRQFGTNDSLHEIFWITDKREWRKLVGAGEFGTLGATLPRYVCDSYDGGRVIFDADLVLNGLPHINWQIDCHNEDCISPITTLTHELGHFFGLDHPCLNCSSSIMSARAGFDLTAPVFDDMQGLRILYPDNSAGGFGFPCQEDNDCQSKRRCINDGYNQYCSNSCSDDNECYLSSTCMDTISGRFCAFADDYTAGGRQEGNSCLKKPCSEPLVCAGTDEFNFYCYMPCNTSLDCASNQTCVPLEQDLSLCVAVKNLNETCDYRDLCESGLYCVFEMIGSGVCRKPCSLTTDNKCFGRDICQRIGEGVEICLPSTYSLADNLDSFNGELKKTPSSEKIKASGCQSVYFASKNDILWLVMALFWLIKMWRSSLLFK